MAPLCRHLPPRSQNNRSTIASLKRCNASAGLPQFRLRASLTIDTWQLQVKPSSLLLSWLILSDDAATLSSLVHITSLLSFQKVGRENFVCHHLDFGFLILHGQESHQHCRQNDIQR